MACCDQNLMPLFSRLTMLLALTQICLSLTLYAISASTAQSPLSLVINPEMYCFSLAVVSLTQIVGTFTVASREENDKSFLRWLTSIFYLLTNFLLLWAFIHICALHSKLDALATEDDLLNISFMTFNLQMLQVTFFLSAICGLLVFFADILPKERPPTYKPLEEA
uniref:Transmembrane protein n=1 Tax=Steinernema glaseri TaxID=37863 RepID=A0A1I7Z8B6_9BILA